MNYRALINRLRRVEPAVSSLFPRDFDVRAIALDSREVCPGTIFAALPGSRADGRSFIEDALKRGASAILTDKPLSSSIPQIITNNPRRTLANLCAQFAGEPSRSLLTVGVTGTNGKTTIATLCQHLLNELGEPCGTVGTVSVDLVGKRFDASMTTPEAAHLQNWLGEMVARGATACTMEVSSHALVQHRTTGVDFNYAIFTNLTQDHLDFHGTMDAYAEAKALLFQRLAPGATAVINADDSWGWYMLENCRAHAVTYGMKPGADFLISGLETSVHGMRFRLRSMKYGSLEIKTSLTGNFNALNIAACATLCLLAGFEREKIEAAISSFRGAPGRLQRVALPEGLEFTQLPSVFVDYAHTPDALENVLTTLRDVCKGQRLVTVFGCGGDRDRTKRPLMGRIAEFLSDVAVVTSDNPRSEEPVSILKEIVAGMRWSMDTNSASSQARRVCEVRVEVDRRAAIELALREAGPTGVVVIAGKGHETYQIIGSTRHHFDDVEEAQLAMSKLCATVRERRDATEEVHHG